MPETLELAFREYTFKRMQPEDVEMPSGLTLIVKAASYEILSDEGPVANGALALEDEDDWLQGCPTNYSSVALQTAVLKGEFTLGPHTFTNPWLAPDCFDSDDVYLSLGKEETLGPCVSLSCVVFEKKD